MAVALDYGSTLNSPAAALDPALGMRPVSDEAAGVLRGLYALRLRLALASNTKGPEQDRLGALRAAGVESLFTLALQSHELGFEKPHPAFFAHLLHDLNCHPHQVLMVGDNLDHDVVPAVEAGMPAVLIAPSRPRRLPPGARYLPGLALLPGLLAGGDLAD
jgi:FMN phosphatase YigB (HAD superfamily)